MKSNEFDRILLFLQRLGKQAIDYSLAHHRDEAVMVIVAVPGERWEIEFLSDGSVEVEKFFSNGEIAGEEALSELFDRYSEREETKGDLAQKIELTNARK
ncbi:hypothetical protein [Tychonema sp. LEGE 06208]|uniref:hypothetical protein n=1 Tax=Tychonema sp. LEGE 06208 TaxID=1828663 RepID=UPI00187F1699|nr:hypothetical protein [Tychonema sp. LEGE 06208]MBE9161635.1 hypothetical protein [Tychonema sp. LEGE 06208]